MENSSLLFGSDNFYNRRQFLSNTGKGIFATSVIAPFAGISASHAQQTGGAPVTPSDIPKISLKPLDMPSEKKDPETPSSLNPARRKGYALVGLGHLTLNQILPAFGQCKYSKPVALVSGDADKARKAAEYYGIAPKNIYNYHNFDDIKNNPDIDAVYIVLPNSMHEEYTLRAAKADKHVLCEKPMATTSAAAQRMIDACKNAGKKLMIAYRIQYEPHNTMVMKWAREKKYGKIKVIEMFNAQNIGDPAQWRLNRALAGGGSLPDIGLYCINTARFVLGEEPEWVSASIYSTPGDERFREVEETVLFKMGFPGGAVVNAGCSYGVHETRRYRCLADNGGSFGLDPAFPYKGLKMEVSEIRDGRDWKSNPGIEAKDQFALVMDHFSQSIINNTQPYTPGEEGLQDQKIMEAIYQSTKENKIIKLDRITTLDTFRGAKLEE